MPVEFDSEIVILQTALNTVHHKYGGIDLLDPQQIEESLKIFCSSMQEILTIRKDEGLSLLQNEQKNRKLLMGLICNVFKERSEFWQPDDYFQAFNDVYPSLSWNFLLELTKTFHWDEYLIECIEAIHPLTLPKVLDQLLDCVMAPTDDKNISILVRILPILIETYISHSDVEKCEISSPDEQRKQCEDQIKKVCVFLSEQLPQGQRWSASILSDFFVCLFACLKGLCDKLMNDRNSINMNIFKSDSSENLTVDNIDEFYVSSGEKNEISKLLMSDEDDGKKEFLICFLELCHESLVRLNCEEILRASGEAELLLRKRYGRLSDLRISFSTLHSDLIKIIEHFGNPSEKFFQLLQLIHQRLDDLFKIISQPSTQEDIVTVINRRGQNYLDCLVQLISNAALFHNEDYLECLKRNSSLLRKSDVLSLLSVFVKEKNLSEKSIDSVQESILFVFSEWPVPLQQQFLQDYLSKYKDSHVLQTKSFEEELTTTFNKVVSPDGKTKKNLLLQMSRLCLQSTRKTIRQAVFQAMNSKAQSDVLIQFLKSVWCCCRFQVIPKDATELCYVLNEILLNFCLTDVQFQNLKIFIRKLLKTKNDNNPNWFRETLITFPELMNTCILPYLDRWNPGHGSRVAIFAIQLLEMMLNADSAIKTCSWLQQFTPCIILCYLCLIIAQCKFIHRKDNTRTDWVLMKLQAVSTLNKLTSVINQNPRLVKKQEIVWLLNNLQKVDESLVFRFVNLCDNFCLELPSGNSKDFLVEILEFSCCNDANCELAKPTFGKIILDLEHAAEGRLILALKQVLPFCLPEEWKRIVCLVDHILQNKDVNLCWNSCLRISSNEGRKLCDLASLLLNVIYSCHRESFNVQYMIQCFSATIKDQLSEGGTISSTIVDKETSYIIAELFVRICYTVCSVKDAKANEWFALLMELSQGQQKLADNECIEVMLAAAENLEESPLRNNLLKVLLQESH